MAKEIFKNLPDKSTPLSATKLNGLFDGEESMGSIVVEDISCKNLWLEQSLNTNATNYNNGKYTYSNSSSNIIINTDSASRGINPCSLMTGEEITWSFEIYTPSDFIIRSSYLCTSKNGSQVNNYEHKNISVKAGTSKIYYTDTIIGDSDALGFVLYGSVPSGTTVSKIQIEKGSVATNYVEHKEFSNKQNYSTSEQVIGTWIDGKPLYRKVVKTTMPTISTNGTYPSNKEISFASDVEFSFLECLFIESGNQRQSLPYLNNAGYVAKGFVQGSLLMLTGNGTAFSGLNATAIILYTKTTD